MFDFPGSRVYSIRVKASAKPPILTLPGRDSIVSIAMATPLIMPKQGQSVESCVILGWKKRPGDAVKAGDVICEVETDKATFEVEAPTAGTLLAAFFEAGADVPVLTTIAAIGAPGESVDALRPSGAAAATTAASPVIASAAAISPAPAPAISVAAGGVEPRTQGGKIMASPRAKALAASRGLSLAGLRGTGPGGRIIERDVAEALQARPAEARPAQARPTGATAAAAVAGAAAAASTVPAASPTTAATPPAPWSDGVLEIRLTSIRKLIAQRMLESMQTTAQLTMNAYADARSLQDLRRKFKESPEGMGLRDVTINDMVLFAVCKALLQHPEMNATFGGEVIRQYAAVHLGFAVDTPKGLMVPVVRGAQSLSLRGIAQETSRLSAACLEGKIKPDELAGGTFTVTNLGSLGVDSFTPVLNIPQVGILGVGGISLRPIQGPDGVAFVPHIGLSLTINHQVVDGAPGARFLQTVAGSIARFELLLAR